MNYRELWYDWMGANDVFFFAINSVRGGEYYDRAMKIISMLGDPRYFPFHISAFATWVGLVLLYRLVMRKKGFKGYLSSCAGILIIFLVGVGVTNVIVPYMQNQFAMPRPQIYYAKPKVIDTSRDFRQLENNYVLKVYKLSDMRVLETLRGDQLNKSFPSSHVAFAVLLVIALWPALSGGMAWVGVLFILLVGWSRIALGVNFPADVVGTLFIFVPLLIFLREILYSALFKVFGLRC